MKKPGIGKKGLTLIELVVVLAILTVVVSMGFSLYFFGTKSFDGGVSRSNVQQNVNLAADAITKEVRYATQISIIARNAIPATISDDSRYIFINDGNLVEFKNKDGSRTIPSAPLEDTTFSLLFKISAGSDKILHFDLGATGKESFNIESEVYPLNLTSAISGADNIAIVYKTAEAAN